MSGTARHTKEMIEAAKVKLAASTDPVDKVRLTCLSRGVHGIKSLGRMFKIMDDNGDKRLCLYEFKKGMRDFGCDVSPEEMVEMFNAFDADKTGSLSFDELLSALRPPMRKCRRDLVMRAFKKLDRTNTGEITIDDLRGVYSAKFHPKYMNGQWTEEDVFLEFLKTFDSPNEPDGIVSWDEFYNYYTGVSASIDSDAYFDVMMRQAWKL